MTNDIIALGAESEITRITIWGHTYVAKRRPRKPYLLSELDTYLRASRTARECKSLNIARSLGIPTPAVHSVDMQNYTLILDHIAGKQLKEAVGQVSPSLLRRLCNQFGSLIGKLHDGNLVHGDPTTSNVIIDKKSRLWMIDFGLSEFNADTEMKGVDLHLIRRAFETTHWTHQDEMLQSTIEGYTEVLGDFAEPNLSRMEEIRTRGRYH
ncbi:Kae1-associated serine/threonine protein kinase [Candidatus Thorarchaeota archaeon]|nr:MAG: Kae1-associated serine/threonine protein kinase [Candidatus Thorarchaeota archaeon]